MEKTRSCCHFIFAAAPFFFPLNPYYFYHGEGSDRLPIFYFMKNNTIGPVYLHPFPIHDDKPLL